MELTDIALGPVVDDLANEARLNAVEGGKELFERVRYYETLEEEGTDLAEVWLEDTRLAVHGSPQWLQLVLDRWEVVAADTAPTRTDRGVILDQIVHFKKKVPAKDLVQRGRKIIDEILNSKILSPLAQPPGVQRPPINIPPPPNKKQR